MRSGGTNYMQAIEIMPGTRLGVQQGNPPAELLVLIAEIAIACHARAFRISASRACS